MEGQEDGGYPWVRVAEYQRAHPGMAICLVEGLWRAWVPKPGGDRAEGTELEPQERLADLLDRLDGVAGGSGAGDGGDD